MNGTVPFACNDALPPIVKCAANEGSIGQPFLFTVIFRVRFEPLQPFADALIFGIIFKFGPRVSRSISQ